MFWCESYLPEKGKGGRRKYDDETMDWEGATALVGGGTHSLFVKGKVIRSLVLVILQKKIRDAYTKKSTYANLALTVNHLY